jgi:hypothetical protein
MLGTVAIKLLVGRNIHGRENFLYNPPAHNLSSHEVQSFAPTNQHDQYFRQYVFTHALLSRVV